MAEIVGIVSAAIGFAQATVAVLDGMNKIKDALETYKSFEVKFWIWRRCLSRSTAPFHVKEVIQ